MAKRKPAVGDEAGLLSAICADPDEDTPRLAYADWLDENGADPARAEFIRVQCRLARGSEFDADHLPLTRRQSQLLTETRKRAWGELPVKPVKERTFRRGFVDRVSLNTDTFLAGAEDLFAQVPVRTIRPLNIWSAWDELLASPHLMRPRGLDLHKSTINKKDAVPVAACEHLANLHELNLGANSTFRGDGLRVLLASPHLGNLRRLDLNDCEIGDDALAALVECKRFPNLRHLNLCGNGITAEGAGHLARAEWLSQLEQLELSYNPIGNEGVRRLAASPLWANHRALTLRAVGLTGAGLHHLVRSPHLQNVTELYLGLEDSTNTLSEIAESPTLTNLSALLLNNRTAATRADVAALARSPLAPRLRTLSLQCEAPDVLSDLFRVRTLAGLKWLSASGQFPRDEPAPDVVRALRSATHLTDLHHLVVWGASFTDQDMLELAECAHLGGLVELQLPGGRMTAAGVEAFIASPHFTQLALLRLPYRFARTDDPLRARLAARFGDGVYSNI